MAIDLGTAATQDSSAFATAAQGSKADSAVQQIQGGTGVVVDSSNPQKPVVSFSGPGTGTVTNTSVTSANGFTGTVINPTTTPAISVGTSVTGILKGNGTGVSAAVAADFPTLNQNTTGRSGSTTSIASIAALRLLSITSAIDGQIITLAGYYAEGDGGGGDFFWNATSTTADNGGTIIAPTGVATGRWYRIYSGWLNVRWFGAKGDDSTDDYTAIANTIAALGANGGVVYFPYGTYLVGTKISLDTKKYIILRGDSGLNGGDVGASIIHSTVTGTSDSISFRDTTGCQMIGLYVHATDASVTGNVVNCSGNASYTAHFSMTSCTIQGGDSGNSCLNLQNCQETYIADNSFLGGASYNILGVSSGSFYCTGLTLIGNTFRYAVTQHIFGPDAGWLISGNIFEPLNNGQAGAINSGGTNCSGITISGNWVGDATDVTNLSTWFNLQGFGISISGNTIRDNATKVTGINIVSGTGISIKANYFASLLSGIVLNSGTSQFDITENEYNTVTTDVTTPAPTAANYGGLGTSPPAITIVSGSNDRGGILEFGTGTAPAAGGLINVTFSTAYQKTPKAVIVCAGNTAATALILGTALVSTTGFTVVSANTPAASQSGTTYMLDYIVCPSV